MIGTRIGLEREESRMCIFFGILVVKTYRREATQGQIVRWRMLSIRNLSIRSTGKRLWCFYRRDHRLFSSGTGEESKGKPTEWRKHQLDTLTAKFDEEPLIIENDEDLQPTWKEMESRVLRRRSLSVEEAKGKTGRRNIRPTDEDKWLQAGLYDEDTPKS